MSFRIPRLTKSYRTDGGAKTPTADPDGTGDKQGDGAADAGTFYVSRGAAFVAMMMEDPEFSLDGDQTDALIELIDARQRESEGNDALSTGAAPPPGG